MVHVHCRAGGRLRIALVTDWYPPAVGGVEVQVHALAHALADRGHAVHVFTTTSGETPPGPVHVERLPFPCLPNTRVAVPVPRHRRELETRLAAGHFDVVHAHGMFSTLAMCGLIAAHRLGLPSVTTHHSLIRPTHLPVARACYLAASRHADIVTAVSEAAADDARLASGRHEVLTLPNGIDVARGFAARRAPSEDIVRITSVMRLKLKKRPYHLVWGFARMLRRVSEPSRVRLTIVGDGPERRRTERLAEILGVGGQVEFLGALPRDEVDRVLAESSMFVSSVRAEAFGLALLEARVAGLATVAFAGGGVREIVEDGRNGLLVGSQRELVDALARLVDDSDLRQRLAGAAREGLDRFSWDAVVDQHLRVYHLVIERRGLARNSIA